MTRSAIPVLVAMAALAPPAKADSRRSFDALARLISPEFRQLDARRDQLHAVPPTRQELSRCPALGYHSRAAYAPDSPRWVQVDLGESRTLDAIVVIPAAGPGREDGPGYCFPTRFRVELADTADFATATVVADQTTDYPPPGSRPVIIRSNGHKARYIRFTATRLTKRNGLYFFALGELIAVSGPRNVAANRPVTASDSIDNVPVWRTENLVDGQSILSPPVSPQRSKVNGYHSDISTVPDAVKWVSVDLGESRPIDEIRLIPARPADFADRSGFGFPLRFRVEADNDPAFRSPQVLLDATQADFPNPGDGVVVVPGGGMPVRYARVIATRLWERTGDFVVALAELQVFSGGANVARNAHVDALDSIDRGLWSKQFLVDGFSSQNQLLDWLQWLEQEEATTSHEEQIRTVDAAWEEAQSRAYRLLERLLAWSVVGGILLCVLGVWRVRVIRRRDAERLRDRIARDLHDEIGSNIGGILLLAHVGATSELEATRGDLAEIERIAARTGEAMRDIVWLLGSGATTGTDLLARLRETAALLLRVEYEFTAADDCLPRKPSLEFRRQLLLALKEILHNIVRHAAAQHVWVALKRERHRVILEVRDDGRGFDPATVKPGTGLRSLRLRAAAVGGELRIESAAGQGTTIMFTAHIR